MLSFFEMGIKKRTKNSCPNINSYQVILWVVLNQLLNNFQSFSDFFACFGWFWWCDLSFHLPPRPWPASPSSWHARSRHRSLRSRRRRPKPKQPAEVWRWAGLGRVGWVGLGGHLEWVPFFSMESWRFESNIPHRSGGCVFFLCVCKLWFLDF